MDSDTTRYSLRKFLNSSYSHMAMYKYNLGMHAQSSAVS